jgi:hypothetical protein
MYLLSVICGYLLYFGNFVVIALNFKAVSDNFQVAFVALSGNCAQNFFIIYLLFVIQKIESRVDLSPNY